MLQRVRKADVVKDSFVKQDGLAYAMECWKYHMSGSNAANLDAKPMGGMTANEDGYGRDANEAQLAQDSRVGAATNTAIEGLKPRLKWAVYKTCGMGQVMNFTLADLVQSYSEATEQLVVKLKNNLDTSYLF